MNGVRWDACTEPEEMLWDLHDLASDRLLRLFACASCRLIWPIVPSSYARRAVEVSERFADGLMGPEMLHAIELATQRMRPTGAWLAAWAAAESANADPWQAAQWAPAWAAEAAAEAAARLSLVASAHCSAFEMGDHAWHLERQSQCAVLRDIIGIPLKSLTIPPAWQQWNRENVANLARSIYVNRRFGDLPQLAETLEQAGCADSDVLDHCRSDNHQVRGRWVLDRLLNKRQEPRASDAWLRRRRGGLSYRLLISERSASWA